MEIGPAPKYAPEVGPQDRDATIRISFVMVFLSGIFVGIAITISMQAVMSKPKESVGQPQDADNVERYSSRASQPSDLTELEDKYMYDKNWDIEHYWPRLSCLCVLLVVQSGSSILLEWFKPLLEAYTPLVFYFTMLVGLGGNAGVQSVVITVRRYAMNQPVCIFDQAKIGTYLAFILAPLAFVRCYIQNTPIKICAVVGISAAVICTMATGFGASLAVALRKFGFDPAHASPAVQVLMDMIGLLIVCLVATTFVSFGWLKDPTESLL